MDSEKKTAQRRWIRGRISPHGIIVSGKRYFSEEWIKFIGEAVIIKGNNIFLERSGRKLGQLSP